MELFPVTDIIEVFQGHVDGLMKPEKVSGLPVAQFKISRQRNLHTCGSRSVFMILRHLGFEHQHKNIKQVLGTTFKDGTDEKTMRALFQCLGVDASILTFSWRRLKEFLAEGRLIIASVDGDDHYMVVHGLTSTTVFVADPFDYVPWRRVITRKEFMRRWDRWGVVVGP